jgi:hypothetical protein
MLGLLQSYDAAYGFGLNPRRGYRGYPFLHKASSLIYVGEQNPSFTIEILASITASIPCTTLDN